MSDEDRRRFETLYGATYHQLMGYALRRTADPADAADVVAETFLVAWRRIDVVPTGDAARLWLYGTARRILANQRRGSQRRLALADRLRQDLAGVAAAFGTAFGGRPGPASDRGRICPAQTG